MLLDGAIGAIATRVGRPVPRRRVPAAGMVIVGGVAATILAGAFAARAQDAKPPVPPPPSLLVAADAAEAYPRVPVAYQGIGFDPATLKSWDLRSQYGAALLPQCGADLTFAFRIVTNTMDRTVHVDGTVTDYRGTELQKVAFDIPVKAGETPSRPVTVKPTPAQIGPFYFRGTWKETAGPLQGTFAAEAGQANCRLVVQDYELVQYPQPGEPLESSTAAAHRGSMGLRLGGCYAD